MFPDIAFCVFQTGIVGANRGGDSSNGSITFRD